MNALFGNKGGKSGGGSSSTPTEDPNTLLSRSTVRIIDVIGEGPLRGLVDGFKSIYLDNTPVQNSDDTYNYQGVTYEDRLGTPDQDYIAGFPSAENEVSVGVQVKASLPVSSQIADEDANAILVKIKVNALQSVDTNTGDTHGTTVQVAFDIKTVSGSFVEVGTMTISGKTTSAYERAQRLELPAGGAPWTLRVRRLTADSASQYLTNDTYVSTYTVLYDAKLSYPDTALLAYKVDAQEFGSNSPSRISEWYGIISDVPSNYDPETRVYTGLWDGTFKKAWHNNPVWALWLLMTHNRFGLGDVLTASNIDKFGLYEISRYCDELVPDGFGGMEPRYAFNGVINSKQDAAAVLDSVASVWRGMIYWGSGNVMFTADMPASISKIVTPANVINGEFNYSGSSLKSRHTSILVTWNDPDDLGRSATESVQRDDLIQKFGYRETTVNAYGCTSRGQARRVGEWTLDTEANETEVVTYQASLDHAQLRPGELISLADPAYAGARYGGRLISVAGSLDSVVIDKGVDLIVGSTYQIAIVMPDDEIITRTLTNTPGSDVTTLTFADALPDTPVDAALWVISGTEVAPRTFRVISNTEKADNVYEITALFHDPTKYARVEENVSLATPSYALQQTGPLPAPTNLSVGEFFKFVGTTAFPAATLSWTSANDARITGFELQIQGPNDAAYRPSIETFMHSYDDYPTDQGTYRFRVRTTALFLKPSAWSYFQGSIYGPAQIPPDVTGFVIATVGATATLSWDRMSSNLVDHFELRFSRSLVSGTWESSDLLVDSIPASATSVNVTGRVGTYLIKAVTFAGSYSINAAVVTSEIAGVIAENVVAIIQEDPDFPGTHDDTQAAEGSLYLANLPGVYMADWVTLDSLLTIGGDFLPEGYYYFHENIDLGALGKANIDYVTAWETLDLNQTMSAWDTLASVNTLETISDAAAVETQIRTSADGVTFTDWERATFGNYMFRVAEFRLHLTSTSVTVSPQVTEASVTIDMDDRIANDYDVACPAAGLRINFEPDFMVPPSVHIDGQGLVTGDYHDVTARDETGFYVQFFNASGVGKSATFDWIAKGYGYKQ